MYGGKGSEDRRWGGPLPRKQGGAGRKNRRPKPLRTPKPQHPRRGATRTETTEIRTSSDVQTSTSAKDEDRGDQGEQARGDQGEQARGDQGEQARGDQGEQARGDRGEEARGDERDRGDAPEGSSLGSKLSSKLGLGHHGDQADRDETDR